MAVQREARATITGYTLHEWNLAKSTKQVLFRKWHPHISTGKVGVPFMSSPFVTDERREDSNRFNRAGRMSSTVPKLDLSSHLPRGEAVNQLEE